MQAVNGILLLWAIFTIAVLLCALFSTKALKNLENFCKSRRLGLDAYRVTFKTTRQEVA